MGDSITICKQWASAGIGEECFWEDWNGCPTPGDSLSPNDVIRDLAATEAKLAACVEALEWYAEEAPTENRQRALDGGRRARAALAAVKKTDQ